MIRAILAAGAAGLLATAGAGAGAAAAVQAPTYNGDVVRVSTGAPNSTVFGNLTVTAPTGSGWATAYPCDTARPLASNINYVAGKTVANFAAVRTDINGDFCVYTKTGTHLIFDQTAETTKVSAGAPVRVLDTRDEFKEDAPPVPAGSITKVHTGAASQTVFGNLTVTRPTRAGWATAYPCDTARPLASNINYVAGKTVANFAAVRTDANGDFCVYTTAPTHLVFDKVAAAAEPATSAPLRKLDTRGPSGSATAPGAGSVTIISTGTPNATVFGNVTVARPTRSGYVTAYPCDIARPQTSNVNFGPGATVANFAAVRTDANGLFCLYTTTSAHLIFDQVGTSTKIASHAAVRKLDTRLTGVSAANVFTVDGTPDDWVTGGKRSVLADPTTYTVTEGVGGLVRVWADDKATGEWFGAAFTPPTGQTLSEGATYTGAARFADDTHPGLDVFGNGRGCNATSGEFTVRQLVRNPAGQVVRMAVDFTQHCEAGESATRGQVFYNSSLRAPDIYTEGAAPPKAG